jgi:PAS domain-containing protein
MDFEDIKFSPQEIIDALPHFVWGKNTDGRYIMANSAYAKICKCPVEEIIGRTDFEILPQELAARRAAAESEVCESREQKKIEEIYSEDGYVSKIEMFIQPVIEDDGTIAGIIAEGNEVREREPEKDEPAEVEKQDEEDIVDNLMIGVYRNGHGSAGRFVKANAALMRMFEADSMDELLNVGVGDLCRDAAKYDELCEKVAKDGCLRNEEFEFKTLKTGRPFWGAATATLKKDENGNMFIDGTIEDITPRVEARRELDTKVAELVKMNTFMVDRELKMMELKEEINRLKRQISSM